jgi:hypothetical protein
VIPTEIIAKVSDLTIGLADKNNRVRSCAQSKYSPSIEIVENESNQISEDIAPVCDLCHLFARSAQTAESFEMKWDVLHISAYFRTLHVS